MKLTYFFLITFLFAGCALVGVPDSRDPKVKLQQGVVLKNEQGRATGAIHLFDQAITLAREKKDKATEATAEFYIGEIYKFPGKGWDQLRDPQKAIDHYSKAINLYEEIKFYKSVALANWTASAAHLAMNKFSEACKSLKEAKKFAEKSDSNLQDTLAHLFEDGGMLININHMLKKNKCM